MSPSLAAFQDALGHAVRGDRLSGAERAALGPILDLPGLALTTAIRKSWCAGRAAKAAHLTLLALPPAERRELVNAWVTEGGGTSSFVHEETEGFLSFIAARLPSPSHALALCRLEQAISRALLERRCFIVANSRAVRSHDLVRRREGAAVIMLTATPADLVSMTDGVSIVPLVADYTYPVLVAPGIPGLMQPVTASQIALWDRAAAATKVGPSLKTAADLVSVGALEIAGH